MRRALLSVLLAACSALSLAAASPSPAPASGQWQSELRAPAYPLVTIDPYFSIWSACDSITGDVTRHWSGRKQPMLAALRVDGTVYRVLGSEVPDPSAIDGNKHAKKKKTGDEWYLKQGPVVFPDAALQTGVNVLPTSTVYTLVCGPVKLVMTFLSPLVPTSLQLMSRPVSYVDFEVSALDGRDHSVQLYYEVSPRVAMDMDMVPMKVEAGKKDGVRYVRTGTVSQNVLGHQGDDLRIDWGYFYLASLRSRGNVGAVKAEAARRKFASGGEPDMTAGCETSNFVQDDIALAICLDFGKVRRSKEETLLLAYDDVKSIKYLDHPLDAYWKSTGNSITREMSVAARVYPKVREMASAFDSRLLGDALKSGGHKYADLCALAYRQAVSAHKLVTGPGNKLFYISKENFSNGCAGTVDVAYPAIPLFLCYSNTLAKAILNPIFDYAESPHWTRLWAPHDVGQYPNAYGQHYGNWMPLEECGNMLLLTAAVVLSDGNANYLFKHWTSLSRWALYAVEHGQYPENQLCTDDFAGKLEHNANLSVKSILGISAYARMARMMDLPKLSYVFQEKAMDMAEKWRLDTEESDHFKLTFDTPGSWSLKYNLIWDRLLGLYAFPQDIVEKELDYYKTRMDPYGVPLDSRRHYSKTDWQLWIAAMTSSREDFEFFMNPVYRFYDETPDRVPLVDWGDTEQPSMRAMQARSVVGGFFMKILVDKALAAGV